MTNKFHSKRLALLVGGGPAPGINGVISAVTIQAIEKYGMKVIGIRNGFKHLVQGDTSAMQELSIRDVKDWYWRGGSFLGTSRTNPAKDPNDMATVLRTLREQKIEALITIGGDDTAFSGSQVHEHAQGSIRVAHVPKTIDNDLPLPEHTPTFGFQTARHVGVQVVRNIAVDARTTSRWYIIVSMGRAAGHLALGIGKAAAATLTIIPEEFEGKSVKIEEVCDIIIGSMIKRRTMGARHGVAVLAEGLLEAIGKDGLQSILEQGDEAGRYGEIEVDPHGHLRLGKILFGRMINDILQQRLEEMGIETTLIDKEVGYELRSADPIPFDVEYTRDLGYGAVQFITSDQADNVGAVISIVGGRLQPIPFKELINPETKRMRTRRVNVKGESYQCAKGYMIRLRKADFENGERLESMANIANMSIEDFRARFEPLAMA